MEMTIKLSLDDLQAAMSSGTLQALAEAIKQAEPKVSVRLPEVEKPPVIEKKTKKPTEVKEPEPPEEQVTADGPEEPEITEVQIRAALKPLTMDGRQKEIKALLEEFGAKNVSGIKEEDYPAFMKRVIEL